MKRPGNPEELGGAVVYPASDASSFMIGQVLVSRHTSNVALIGIY